MIAAAVLNELTTKSSINSLVRVTASGSEVILHDSTMTPDRLSLALSPILGRIRSRQVTSAPVETKDSDLSGELTRLAALHKTGALTDEEFSAAKARLLN